MYTLRIEWFPLISCWCYCFMLASASTSACACVCVCMCKILYVCVYIYICRQTVKRDLRQMCPLASGESTSTACLDQTLPGLGP